LDVPPKADYDTTVRQAVLDRLLRMIEDILGMQLADDPTIASIALHYAREEGLEDVKRWRGLLRSQAEYIKSL
jgi:hypothetical protein